MFCRVRKFDRWLLCSFDGKVPAVVFLDSTTIDHHTTGTGFACWFSYLLDGQFIYFIPAVYCLFYGHFYAFVRIIMAWWFELLLARLDLVGHLLPHYSRRLLLFIWWILWCDFFVVSKLAIQRYLFACCFHIISMRFSTFFCTPLCRLTWVVLKYENFNGHHQLEILEIISVILLLFIKSLLHCSAIKLCYSTCCFWYFLYIWMFIWFSCRSL